ncbi:selenocysteine-specific translation elongation factor [Tsukamurella paurometabola]|uniref:Selenocysteine-specific elongation factor n=1 Tax=Tsukamurella paurometabola TaxID=2061 RepID=A0A3P8JWP6_TSUPA|nr:selenocysteine-specific translation elongation factor [Tsukamurella paurometabola]UEA84685.1 selenocysteine-specific translation elongation factor [Tsukamurella paurometabola]VDR37264.1 SelB translation factor [Tsukamurella paurometabola]
MYVVATAGHVDHGKSTLVRALTGIEPDRWAEEQRRGLTIDLGFAWTALPSGRELAFVDVPGHERFLGNMLAGLGPVPVVCFVVAADEGWSAQSDDHRDAVAALGIEHGLIVVTKADRAPGAVAAVTARARRALAGTGLKDAPAVAVSAVTGAGLDELRGALDAVLADVPRPDPDARVRIWIDRAFSVVGAGTVVTGTVAAGTVRVGDELELLGARGARRVTVRGLQRHGTAADAVGPVSRVAVNLRGVAVEEIHRGDALLTPGQWPATGVVDVRLAPSDPEAPVPEWLTVHAGTVAVPARVRPFGGVHARLTLARRLPLVLGDALVLRDPGEKRIVGGARVLDADPPPLRRRGDGARRGDALAGRGADGDLLAEVERRGAVRRERLDDLGYGVDVPEGVRVVGPWWIHEAAIDAWQARLRGLVADLHDRDPLAAGLSLGAAREGLGLPDPSLLATVLDGAGLESEGGRLALPGHRTDLGPAESAVADIERRLAEAPFAAPEADDLAALRLGTRELAAAERAGRLLRLAEGVVLAPRAPALAMRELARLPQPFTVSQARQALGTSRRVAVPLLELLDARGWTRRLDAGRREVAR